MAFETDQEKYSFLMNLSIEATDWILRRTSYNICTNGQVFSSWILEKVLNAKRANTFSTEFIDREMLRIFHVQDLERVEFDGLHLQSYPFTIENVNGCFRHMSDDNDDFIAERMYIVTDNEMIEETTEN
jgi:hypothetical protein